MLIGLLKQIEVLSLVDRSTKAGRLLGIIYLVDRTTKAGVVDITKGAQQLTLDAKSTSLQLFVEFTASLTKLTAIISAKVDQGCLLNFPTHILQIY